MGVGEKGGCWRRREKGFGEKGGGLWRRVGLAGRGKGGWLQRVGLVAKGGVCSEVWGLVMKESGRGRREKGIGAMGGGVKEERDVVRGKRRELGVGS